MVYANILSGPDLLIVGAILLVLFGGSKLPEFGRGIGQAMREFRAATAEKEEQNAAKETPA